MITARLLLFDPYFLYLPFFFFLELQWNPDLVFLAHLRNCEKRLLASSHLSVFLCPSKWNNSASDGWIFHVIWCWIIFWKSFEKIQVSLKSEKHNRYFFSEDQCTFLIISRLVLLRMRNVSDKSCRSDQNTHFCSITPPPQSKKILLLWGNVGKYCRVRQATDDSVAHVQFMLYTWGYKYTLIYSTYCFSTGTVVALMRLSVTLHIHFLSHPAFSDFFLWWWWGCFPLY